MTREEASYQVLWPRGKRHIESVRYAKRFDDLNNKTIGELWDWVFRADEIFPILEEELSRRFPGVKFVSYQTFGSTHGGDEGRMIANLGSKLKENGCDAVISAMGC